MLESKMIPPYLLRRFYSKAPCAVGLVYLSAIPSKSLSRNLSASSLTSPPMRLFASSLVSRFARQTRIFLKRATATTGAKDGTIVAEANQRFHLESLFQPRPGFLLRGVRAFNGSTRPLCLPLMFE